MPLIILTCNTCCRINIQPTTNLIFATHTHINTTSFLSHLFSFKGTLLTHSIFSVKAEVIHYDSIIWYFDISISITLRHSSLRWLTASTFSPAFFRKSSLSSPKLQNHTMVDSWIQQESASYEQDTSTQQCSGRPPPGIHLYYTLVEEFLYS